MPSCNTAVQYALRTASASDRHNKATASYFSGPCCSSHAQHHEHTYTLAFASAPVRARSSAEVAQLHGSSSSSIHPRPKRQPGACRHPLPCGQPQTTSWGTTGVLPHISAFIRMMLHVAALRPMCAGQKARPFSVAAPALCTHTVRVTAHTTFASQPKRLSVHGHVHCACTFAGVAQYGQMEDHHAAGESVARLG